jgi:flagellar biosynthesis GTPase FlhF
MNECGSCFLQIALAVIQEQKASVDALVNLHAQCASSAERAASLIEIQLKEAQATAVDLEAHLHQAKAELQSAQENSIITEQKISSALHEWTNELEKAVKDLEQKNVELSRRSVDILLRYQQGNVVRSFRNAFVLRLTLVQTDIEKGFVAYIMKQTRDIHEQSVVAKDNELRRVSCL